jgi:NNP family nitrate/nitrite transporter-like MFS transporter
MSHSHHSKYTALITATGLLTLNFWAWSLISPIGTAYATAFSLSPFMLSALVATPVIVGSLGRVPLGLLADRFGGGRILGLVCVASASVVLALTQVSNVPQLYLTAFALGIAGASFAAGVPLVNSWFKKRERGLALGLYALGNAGTAVSGLLTPRLATTIGRNQAFLVIAALLLIAGVLVLLFGREGPGWKRARGDSRQRLQQAFAWRLTWRLSLLYALSFGAFVALGLYLPVLLHQSYGLGMTDAAARAAGFVLLATLARPIGGWLSDRLSGLAVLRTVFLTIFGLAVLAAARPGLAPLGTIAYLGLAIVLGVGNGALFAVIGHRCEAKIVGTVTGIVGAAGGLGGFFPPLIMGLSYQLFRGYTAALLLLAVVSLIIFISLRRLFGYGTRY